LKKLLRTVLILLLIVCVYDPEDKILGIKVYLFVMGWLLFSLMVLCSKNTYVSKKMLIYLSLFILIPLISIFYYFFTGDYYKNYDGYAYFKAYLFVTIAIILYATRIDLLRPLIAILTSVSLFSITILAFDYFNISSVVNFFVEMGPKYGVLSIGYRQYGTPIIPSLKGVYFYVSDVLVFPIGYFTMKIFFSKGIIRIRYGLLLVINMIAMFFSATRNNILATIMIPILIIFWYSKSKVWPSIIIVLLIGLSLINIEGIEDSMFRKDNVSNITKLSFFNDYLNLFSDEEVLLFGQGLGSYFKSTKRGYVSLTELTYFEFIRRFGLILAIPSFALLLYPLIKLRSKKNRSEHYLYLIYLFYLVMSFFNPFLMSSNGMMILVIVLYKTFPPTSLYYIMDPSFKTGKGC
jgi:hypothetical protein